MEQLEGILLEGIIPGLILIVGAIVFNLFIRKN